MEKKETRKDRTRARILKLLQSNAAKFTEKEILEFVVGRTSDICDAIRELLRDNYIRRTSAGVKGDPFHYEAIKVDAHPATVLREEVFI